MNKNTISPTKSLLSTYLTCHSSAIYTCKVTCLPCMLFTCLFLLPHINYSLNYILVQVVDKSFFEMVLPIPLYTKECDTYFRFRTNRLLADMGTRNDRYRKFSKISAALGNSATIINLPNNYWGNLPIPDSSKDTFHQKSATK